MQLIYNNESVLLHYFNTELEMQGWARITYGGGTAGERDINLQAV
jgi:hypothetical protein